jgi:glutamyl-tRNA synthetase
VADGELAVTDDALTAVTKDAGQTRTVIDATVTALTGLGEWNAGAIEQALRAAVLDGLGLKPRLAFTPVRVAVTGRRVSPPLFESMEILGADSCLTRLAALRGRLCP